MTRTEEAIDRRRRKRTRKIFSGGGRGPGYPAEEEKEDQEDIQRRRQSQEEEVKGLTCSGVQPAYWPSASRSCRVMDMLDSSAGVRP